MNEKFALAIVNHASFIQYTPPNSDYIDNKKIVSEIKNAWDKSCSIDKHGRIWISEKHLHSILRTSKDNAKYYINQLNKEHKSINGEITYIKGSEVIRYIDEMLQTAGGIKREKNLKYSYNMYSAIRDSDPAKLIRAEYYESIKNCSKKLKKYRIKKFNILNDELTGKALEKKTCEFSHIRSCSMYPHLIDNIYNGHIVNKDIHKIITDESINDEDELFALCKKMNWNIDWYDNYTEFFSTT